MPVTQAEAQADLAAVWRIAQETGTLPMPGGHGVWPILSPGSCRHYAGIFPLALRAKTIVLMLANARLGWEDHKATTKEWVDKASKELNHVLTSHRGPITNPFDQRLLGLTGTDVAPQPECMFSPHELLDALYEVVKPHVCDDKSDRTMLEQLWADSKTYMRAIGYATPHSPRQVPPTGPVLAALRKASKAILPSRELAEGLPECIPDDDRTGFAYRVLAHFHCIHASHFERWLAKSWRDATLDWFAVHAPEWNRRPPREKCDAMFDAIVEAGKPSAEEVRAARSRMAALAMTDKPLRPAFRQPDGNGASQPTPEQTRLLCDGLRDPSDGPKLRARLLIRALLTRLGMTGHLTKRPTEPTRAGLYDPLTKLLSTCFPRDSFVDGRRRETPAEPCPGLREAIAQAADLIEGLRHVVDDIGEWKKGETPQARLFALYDDVAPPSIHTFLYEADEGLQPGIRALDVAARLVVDVLLDPMHAGQARYFGQRQYNFLAGAIKGKESLHNYFAHLSQDPCATRIAVQACVPMPGESARARCPLCLRG